LLGGSQAHSLTPLHMNRGRLFLHAAMADTPELNLLTQLVEGRFVSVCDLVTTSEPGKLLRWQLQVCKFQVRAFRDGVNQLF